MKTTHLYPFMVFLWIFSGVLYAQSDTIFIPPTTGEWDNMQCGQVRQESNGLYVYGSGNRIGANIHSKSFFDLTHDARLSISLIFLPWDYANFYAGSSVVAGAANTRQMQGFRHGDTLYISLSFHSSDSTAHFRIAKHNYAYNGGQVIYQRDYSVSRRWDLLASTDIIIGFNDNYGGNRSFFVLREVMLENAQPVDREAEIHGIVRHGFEDGQMPPDWQIIGNPSLWEVTSDDATQSFMSLHAEAPVHEEASIVWDVQNAVKVAFDIKYSSETHKYMRFLVDSVGVAVFDEDTSTCWRHFEWQFDPRTSHRLIWRISGTPYDTQPGLLWLDNVVLYTTDTTYTAIPDSLFEAALSPYDDIPQDHRVPTLAIDTVTALDVSGRGISDLTGIEDFYALSQLNVASNQLDSIDVSHQYFLQDLRAYNNQLSALDTRRNPNLQRLVIWQNQITSLDISQNPALSYLSCYNNLIDSLNLQNNNRLVYLFVGNNRIDTLDISRLTRLYRIGVRNNRLTSLDLSHQTGLFEVTISGNPIRQIDLSTNPSLQWIYASRTQLQSLDLSHNTMLRRIDFSHNDSLSNVFMYHVDGSALMEFNGRNCPDLTCIFVDDPAWWEQHYSQAIDSTSHFVADQNQCDAVFVAGAFMDGIKIYPNPAKNSIYVEGLDEGTYQWYNPDGKVLEQGIIEGSRVLSTEGFVPGIYFLKLQDRQGNTATRKVLIE